MPEVSGRIVEPALGEFPLIEDGGDGAADPDPAKAEPHASVLVVVLQERGA